LTEIAKGFNIGVVGAGYVGLVTGACLANLGHHVMFVDKDEERLACVEVGRVPLYEPGLEELVTKNADQLHFSTNLGAVVCNAEVVFIAVDTPKHKTDLLTSQASLRSRET
jgi:UDPglucose 6-dehydrogenase